VNYPTFPGLYRKLISSIVFNFGLIIVCTACSPAWLQLQNQAESQGLTATQIPANAFTLAGFYQIKSPGDQIVHIYLEGDGKPFEQGLMATNDPTTRASVVLPLMALDTASKLYLARPCYNGHALDKICNPSLWTTARYSETVVLAMAAAIHSFCVEHGFRKVILIGHSGGGAIAMLVAGHLPETQALITLAGNYDIDAWADFHGYDRLSLSLNPAQFPNTGIPEWHYLGDKDSNIPPVLFSQDLLNRANSHVIVLPDTEHNYGWVKHWPNILSEIGSIH
jgi:pimeloyl-ACP methyl ester carboxylesterase